MRKLTGLICLAFVIIITVFSSILIKHILNDSGYNKPLTLTYYNYCFLSLLIPVYYIKNFIVQKFNDSSIEEQEIRVEDLAGDANSDNFSDTVNRIEEQRMAEYKYNFHKIVMGLMILWYLGNAFYNLGLNSTSISSSNTISNISIVFILLQKVMFTRAICTTWKVIALVLTTGGLAIVGWMDSKNEDYSKNSSVLGDVFIVIGAFFYSIFANLVKYFSTKYKNQFDMMEIFGYIGFYNMIMIPFFLILVNLLQIEEFSFPNGKQMLFVFINALVGSIISDLLQNYSIIFLNPHIVSFGLTIGIPLSYSFDIFSGRLEFSWFYVIASCLIILGFALILIEKFKNLKEQYRRFKRNRDKYLNKTRNESIHSYTNYEEVDATEMED